MKNNKGLTLTILVITIIVMIIISGATLYMSFGETGVIQKSIRAAVMTDLSKAEEDANIIYIHLLEESDGSVNLTDVVGGLVDKGYSIQGMPANSSEITGITLSKKELSLTLGGSAHITVTYDTNTEGTAYYIRKRDKYFRIRMDDEGVNISRISKDVEESSSAPQLSVEVLNNDAKVTAEIVNGNQIDVSVSNSGITEALERIVKVTYGNFQKTCKVSVTL